MQKVAVCKIRFIVAIVLLSFAFVFSFQCSNNLFHVGNVGTDSSVFKYIGRIIIDGGMPYKDAFDHKGPLIYLINVLGMCFGAQRGIWVVEFCVIYLSLLLFYKIARQKCNELLSCLIAIFCTALLFDFFEGGNLVEEYALPFIALSIYIFFDFFEKCHITNYRLLLCGASFGAVCLLRINMISLWAIMCMGVVFTCLKQKCTKELLRYSVMFIAGACIVVVPIFLWLVKGDAFKDFIDCYWTFNRMYSENNSIADRGTTIFTFLNNSTLLFIITVYVVHVFKERRLFDSLYLLYITMELMMISLSGNYYMHYGMVLVPAIVYPTSCIVHRVEKIDIDFFLKVVIAGFILSYSALPAWCSAVADFTNDFATRNNTYISEYYLRVKNVIEAQSKPGDKIIVCDNDDFIYNISNRFAATKYSYMTNPLILSEQYKNDCYKQIADNPPQIVVLPNDYFDHDVMLKFIAGNKYTLMDQVEKYPENGTQKSIVVDVYVLEK